MKNFLIIIFSLLVFISCSKKDDEISFDINGQFTDNIVKCSSVEVEPNCFKSISFIDDSKAYALVFGDIVLTMNYKIQGSEIELEKNANYDQDISFKIINETTLQRIQDDAIFEKNNI